MIRSRLLPVVTVLVERPALTLALWAGAALALGSSAEAVQLDVGSTGADGAFNPAGNVTIDLATQGTYDPDRWAVVFNYTSVSIASGRNVYFLPHPSNAPVVWLVSGDVTINGTIHIEGQDYVLLGYARGGPGGFRGGIGAQLGVNESAGFGPGGAFLSSNNQGTGGSYATLGTTTSGAPAPGPVYGGPVIFPLIGGSGGSPEPDYVDGDRWGGAGGGGAMLSAATGNITVNGSILGNGGAGRFSGGGSGGALRLLANTVTLGAANDINFRGGFYYDNNGGSGGLGRVRIEGNGPGSVQILKQSSPEASVSLLPGTPFPLVEPRVRVTSITVGSQTYDVSLLDPMSIIQPPNSADVQIADVAGPATLMIEGTNIPVDGTGMGPVVKVRVTYARGEAIEYTTPPLQGTLALSTTTHVVNLSAGVSAIQARVRLVP